MVYLKVGCGCLGLPSLQARPVDIRRRRGPTLRWPIDVRNEEGKRYDARRTSERGRKLREACEAQPNWTKSRTFIRRTQ